MACVKLGSKADSFQRRGHAWYSTTGLPSDVLIKVGEISFHLHKFPLLSRSVLIEHLIAEKADDRKEGYIINMTDIPGGARTLELVAKFCYGIKFELTSSNVVPLLCASHHLQMTEEIAEDNLISITDNFLNQVVFKRWNDSIKAFRTCEEVLPCAEKLGITKRCVESLAIKACTAPSLSGWTEMDYGLMQSPGGSLLWNGISTGAKLRDSRSDWWYEDVSSLSLFMFKKLIHAMESRGVKQEVLAGSITHYAQRYLPGLRGRHGSGNETVGRSASSLASVEEEQNFIEEIDDLLLVVHKKGVASTKFLFALLRSAMILKVNHSCISNMERRIGFQLEQASLEDLLISNLSDSTETLYDVNCVERILHHFLAMEQDTEGDDEQLSMPLTTVGKLIDGFLAEVASDVNLKPPSFQSIAAALPDFARPLHDGLYRAIDIYLKAHPWLLETEREELCRLMDCQKLSVEACTHAAQNERLPLRIVVQVLFFEQLQLRNSVAGFLMASTDDLEGLRPPRNLEYNQFLKFRMENMRTRVSELEKECLNMKQEIVKLGRAAGTMNGKGNSAALKKKLGLKIKTQICGTKKRSLTEQNEEITDFEKPLSKQEIRFSAASKAL